MTRESITTSRFFSASPRDHIDAVEVFERNSSRVGAHRHVIDGDLGSHDHGFLEIALVLGGTALHRTVHGDKPIHRGMGIVLPAGGWHAYLNCDRLELYDCYVATDMLWNELSWTRDDPVFSQLIWSPRSLNRDGGTMFELQSDALSRAVEQCDAILRLSNDTSAINTTAAHVGRLLLLFQEMRGSAAHDFQDETAAMPAAVRTCIELFEKDVAHNWTLGELADAVSLNGSYLTRLFHRWTGLPPKSYLARWRLERAAELLLHTDKPISTIACDVGWFDSGLFARHFRARFGVSASQYREHARKPATELVPDPVVP
ncbi:AraC family transcriptional regulator [Sphingomonas sp. PAMC 26605]|uniref:AraC family transcriptional regulator n=1 Tax=Sphingomonas sp. PAMC 26605 TaxID=1112214 RepID=UPI00026CABA6|nr:AraC family transcriptional regulator [Sphingomonas sp. PAMC 26605]